MSRTIFFLLLLFCASLIAHPPKSIELTYDEAKTTLSVKVWHKVSNSESHFIKRIVVLLGDEPIAEKTYERQQTDAFQEEVFIFNEKPLKRNDALKVQAVCNVFGKKTADLQWPK